jgi:ribonucleotide reductase beta subunit family protein with ferritin-like domain
MFSCGLIINFLEMNKSEGNFLVSMFLESTNKMLDNSIQYICYDDACHINNLSDKLSDKIFVIGFYPLFKSLSPE